MYAHIADREWEVNQDIIDLGCNNKEIDDIAKQLIRGEVGSKLSVIFGGGRAGFRDKTMNDEESEPGRRTDGLDLIQEWLERAENNENRTFIWNRVSQTHYKVKLLSLITFIHFQEQMMNLTISKTDKVLGLFHTSHTKYNYQIDGIDDMSPTLSEMTMTAVEILSRNPKGFFLFVEGGQIDIAHHHVKTNVALDETVEFAKTIGLAHDRLGDKDTLHVVTADHAHTMSFSGWADRQKPSHGMAGRSLIDGLPYMTLTYANGNGYHIHKDKTSLKRNDPSKLPVQRHDFEFPSTVPEDYEDHGGDDVVIYSTGPHAHLFKGTIEQNIIPHLMGYASCIGKGLTACDKQT